MTTGGASLKGSAPSDFMMYPFNSVLPNKSDKPGFICKPLLLILGFVNQISIINRMFI